MTILKKGNNQVEEIRYHGTCSRCGCDFLTTVSVTTYMDGSIGYEPMDDRTVLHRLGPTILLCDCPECGRQVYLDAIE